MIISAKLDSDIGHRSQHGKACRKTILGALLAVIGITVAQAALADRDSFPAWQHQQFVKQTMERDLAMPAPRTVFAGRDSSFQNWQYRQYAQQLREQQADIATARACGSDMNPGASDAVAR